MIKIEKASASNIDFIVECQVQMALETEELKLNLDTVKKGVTAVVSDENKGEYLVANVDGELSGVLLLVKEWSDWRNTNVLWIHSVFVIPKYRKHGVYKALYNKVKNEVLNNSSLSGIRLYVDKKNTSAAEVYQKLGMSDEHYQLYEWLKPS